MRFEPRMGSSWLKAIVNKGSCHVLLYLGINLTPHKIHQNRESR